MSLPWLGVFKSEMMKGRDSQTDRRTQPFIVKDIHLVEVLGGWLAYNIVMTAQSPKVSCQELKKSPCLCVIFLNFSLSLHKSCSDLSLTRKVQEEVASELGT